MLLISKYSKKLTSKVGLGTLVKFSLKPVVYVLDGLFRTKFSGCDKCGCRESTLNKLIPNVNPLNLLRK